MHFKVAPQNILLAGASGLIGQQLIPELLRAGHRVTVLQRRSSTRRAGMPTISWDPTTQYIEERNLSGFQSVICLSGEGIASKRWSAKRKHEIMQSRLTTASFLATLIKTSPQPPPRFLCASAIGYYGISTQDQCTESHRKGTGFLADVCEAWENAALLAQTEHTRVLNLRFAMVLSHRGGALAKMLPSFRCYLGASLGNGKQALSWIHLSDACLAICFLLGNAELSGPINISSPSPTSNREFSMELAKALKRPCWFSLPATLMRFFFGQMGEELLLHGNSCPPQKLLELGFPFQYPTLSKALEAECLVKP